MNYFGKKKIRFNVLGLHNFFHGLQGELGLESIRLRTDRDDLFTTYQLEHAANRHNPFEPDSFTGQLKKVRGDISWFSFKFWKNDDSKRVEIFFDLRNNTVELKSFHGIAPKEIEELLHRSFPQRDSLRRGLLGWLSSFFLWVWRNIIVVVIVGVAIAGIVYLLGWN